MFEPYTGAEGRFYWVEEETYGETPASPSLSTVLTEKIHPNLDPGLMRVRGGGSRDLHTIRKGLRKPVVKVIYYPQKLTNVLDFLCKAIEGTWMTGNVVYDKADTIVSLVYTGSVGSSVKISCIMEDLLKVEAELWSQDFDRSTAKIGGATYPDIASQEPVTWMDCYMKKGATLLQHMTDFSITVKNNLKRVATIKQEYGNSSNLASNAAEDQKDVEVVDGSQFNEGEKVFIQDDNASEVNQIDTIATNTLTMKENLQNTYTTTDNGKVTVLVESPLLKCMLKQQRDVEGEITFEFESEEEYDDVMTNKTFPLELGFAAFTTQKLQITGCKWKNVGTPTPAEGMLTVQAPFVAKSITW